MKAEGKKRTQVLIRSKICVPYNVNDFFYLIFAFRSAQNTEERKQSERPFLHLLYARETELFCTIHFVTEMMTTTIEESEMEKLILFFTALPWLSCCFEWS